MGKIVKYCNSCDEGFAEKFGFCPDCGQALEAFELNPLAADAPAEPVKTAPAEIETVERLVPPPETSRNIEEPVKVRSKAKRAAEAIPVEAVEAIPVEEVMAAPTIDEVEAPPPIEEPVTSRVEEPIAAPVPAKAAPVTYVQTKPVDIDQKPISLEAAHDAALSQGGFYVTVIEEKNAKQRNVLLLGTLGFMVLAVMGLTVYSLFAKELGVGAIGGDDVFLASLIDSPMDLVEEKQKKEKDSGGGGGGGGREEKEEVNKGDLADQSPNPIRPPDVHVPRLENPSLVLPPASTQGNMKFEKVYDRYGDPNGRFDSLSNGPGSGGGIGSGRGTGQGNGNGTGAGNGNGSGFGNGDGNGNGNGTGNGGDFAPPPPKKPGVTTGLNILSKPRPGYTDSARQANIQGTVILRVTFLANGQIGSISPVKGLPNGLTEQAIAAARRISFEPKKVDGVGQSVTRQIEYTFSIY
jgi:TonB family protein